MLWARKSRMAKAPSSARLQKPATVGMVFLPGTKNEANSYARSAHAGSVPRPRCSLPVNDQVLERVWAPDTVVDTTLTLSKPMPSFVRGEMWLGENGSERRLLPGDPFTRAHATHRSATARKAPHYWVARRD